MPMTRLRQARLLVRPLLLAMAWPPLVLAALLGVIAVFILVRPECQLLESGAPCVDLPERIQALRLAALLIAVGTAFVLDDPVEEMTAHLPTPRWLVRTLRIALGLPPLLAAWLASVAIAGRSLVGRPLPVAALTLEAAALAAVSLAATAAAAPLAPGRRGSIGGVLVLLIFVTVALLVPDRHGLFVETPSFFEWGPSHRRWGAVLAAGLLVLAWQSKDQGAPRRVRPAQYPLRALASGWPAAQRVSCSRMKRAARSRRRSE